MIRRLSPAAEHFRRLLAVGGIALVLALGVLAVCPELHQELHRAPVGHDDGCAVVLFAQGVSLPVDTALIAAAPVAWHELVRAARPEIFLTSPRYLRQPERGPPAC